MLHLVKDKEWKPRFYDTTTYKAILTEHVVRFFGCQSARMLRGFPPICKTWSTRESLDAVGAVKESMPKDAFRDMYRCLHFCDDWEDNDGVNWEDKHLDDKYEKSPDSAKYQEKAVLWRMYVMPVGRNLVHWVSGLLLTRAELRAGIIAQSILDRSPSQSKQVQHFIPYASRKGHLQRTSFTHVSTAESLMRTCLRSVTTLAQFKSGSIGLIISLTNLKVEVTM